MQLSTLLLLTPLLICTFSRSLSSSTRSYILSTPLIEPSISFHNSTSVIQSIHFKGAYQKPIISLSSSSTVFLDSCSVLLSLAAPIFSAGAFCASRLHIEKDSCATVHTLVESEGAAVISLTESTIHNILSSCSSRGSSSHPTRCRHRTRNTPRSRGRHTEPGWP